MCSLYVFITCFHYYMFTLKTYVYIVVIICLLDKAPEAAPRALRLLECSKVKHYNNTIVLIK